MRTSDLRAKRNAEEDSGKEVPVEGRQVKKNRRKKENKRADKEKLREQDDAFEAQIDEYQELMAKDKEDDDNLSQEARGG